VSVLVVGEETVVAYEKIEVVDVLIVDVLAPA
jgi:hypothetical protein